MHWLPNIRNAAESLHQALEKAGIMKNGMINMDSFSIEEDPVQLKMPSRNRSISTSFPSPVCAPNLRNKHAK